MMLNSTKSQIPRKYHIVLVTLFINTKLAGFSASKESAQLLCSLFSMQSNLIMRDVPGSTELLSLTKNCVLEFSEIQRTKKENGKSAYEKTAY